MGCQRRFDKGGSNRVDANAIGGELHTHGLGEPFDGVLRHTVDGPVGRPSVPHLRRHVDDDAATALGHHLVRGCLGHDEHRLHVQGEQEIQVGLADVEEGLGNVTTGVVDQHVEALQSTETLVHLRRIRHITYQWSRCSPFLVDERGHLLQVAGSPAD